MESSLSVRYRRSELPNTSETEPLSHEYSPRKAATSMNNHLDNRQIRVFISSTFKDMQEERDYLMTKVFPLLQAEAEKRDVTVTPLDLRWGITEEDSKSGKVLQICLQEIENSHPFFIGIIGNRYGWCPPKEEYEKNEILQERWGNWLKRDFENGLSVTEMEIQYGVLRSKNDIRAHFYLKRGEKLESDNEEKLEKLKTAIRENGRYPVDDYSSPVELGELLKESFMVMLDELYPYDSLSELERDRNLQRAFLHSRTEVYIPNDEYVEVLDHFLENPEQNHFVVTGESGIGKSALLANWIMRHQEDTDRNIIYHFVGSSNIQGNFQHVALCLSREISDIYNLPTSLSHEHKKPEDIFQECIYSIAGKKPLVIVIDGINQIANENGSKLLNWLPQVPKNVKFLFSTLSDDVTMETFRNRNYPVYTLYPLDTEQKKDLVGKYLRKYGKSLSDRLVNHIINAPICNNTLVLKTLLDELVSYGCHEKLSERIDYYLNSDSAESFFQRVIERFEVDFGIDFVRQVLGLISVSRRGLGENEILEIIGLDNQLGWSQLYCAIRSHLTIKNGLVELEHYYIHDAVTSRYSEFLQYIRWKVIHCFKNVRTVRAYDELPYQYYMLGKIQPLLNYILDFDVADYHIRNSYYLFGQYWTIILASGKQPQDMLYYYLTRCNEVNYTNATVIANIGVFFEKFFGVQGVSLAYSNKALEIIKDGKDVSSADPAIIYGYIGTSITECGDVDKFPEAEVYFKFAIRQQQQKFGSRSFEVAKQYYNLGSLYNRWDKLQKAKECLTLIRNIYEETLEPNNIHFASVLAQLGSVYNQLGEYPQAMELLITAKDIYFSHNLTLVEQVADIYYNFAGIYSNMGFQHEDRESIDKAINYCKLAIEIVENTNHLRIRNTGLYYSLLGCIYVHLRDFNDAQTCLSKAIDIYKNTVGEDAREIYDVYFSMGKLYKEMGKTKEANAYFLICSVYFEDTFGEKHINAAIVNHSYGYSLYDDNKKLLAREYMLKALKVFEKEYGMTDERTRSLSADIYCITKELGMI